MVEIDKTIYYTLDEMLQSVENNLPIWADYNYDVRSAMRVFSGGAKWFVNTKYGWLPCTRKEEAMLNSYLSSTRDNIDNLMYVYKVIKKIMNYQIRVEKKYVYIRLAGYGFNDYLRLKIDRREYSENKLRKEINKWINSRE